MARYSSRDLKTGYSFGHGKTFRKNGKTYRYTYYNLGNGRQGRTLMVKVRGGWRASKRQGWGKKW